MHKTTVEQWQVLRTVIVSGGYSRAAERLNRSQSSVSYTIAQLQDRLGAELVVVEGRKVRLTEAGAALLRDAAPLIAQFEALEARAGALAKGAQASLRLAIDSAYPKRPLFAVLRDFAERFPHTQVDLVEIIRLGAREARARSDLAIVFQAGDVLEEHRLRDVELIAVAHCRHPLLTRSAAGLTTADLGGHLQVALVDGRDPDRAAGLSGRRFWSVNTLEAAREAVLSGLCFGWLPEETIADLLDAGELRRLPLSFGARRSIPLSLVLADAGTAGPATRALAAMILERDGTRGSHPPSRPAGLIPPDQEGDAGGSGPFAPE
ncbi:MAG: LysR family transcriptional regulator [Telmatospirillum sp.]|nr:LysR family transcriptional regulator [Telmatospirillum sp.]